MDHRELLVDACKRGDLEEVKRIVDEFHLTEEDARSRSNEALCLACFRGHLEVAQWLVDRFGLTVEDADSSGALEAAACWGQRVDAVRWLLSTFPDLHIPDSRAEFVEQVRKEMDEESEEELMVKPAANTGE